MYSVVLIALRISCHSLPKTVSLEYLILLAIVLVPARALSGEEGRIQPTLSSAYFHLEYAYISLIVSDMFGLVFPSLG